MKNKSMAEAVGARAIIIEQKGTREERTDVVSSVESRCSGLLGASKELGHCWFLFH